MDPIGKAIWYIESHLAMDLSLDSIAKVAGVSRYHLARAFGYVVGISAMRYVRQRRLSIAAQSLSDGAPSILGVALEAGYNSHEAFSRAFKDVFGVSPETVRESRSLCHLPIMEPIKLTEDLLDNLEPERFETGRRFWVAGLSEHYTDETIAGIPLQWQKFAPHIGTIPGQVGTTSYGICYNGDGEGAIDYMAAVEVADVSNLPSDLDHMEIKPQRYAVFLHADHISTIRRTVRTIWGKWLPESGYEVAQAPDFELYDERFDGMTGNGGVEIWIPIKS